MPRKYNKHTDSIEISHPQLALEWDHRLNTLSPDDFTAGSNQKVHWICNRCNHKWLARISNRTDKRGWGGCPACPKKLVVFEKSLAALFPAIAEEWDYLRNNLHPKEVTAGSMRKVYWICPAKQHSYEMTIYTRSNYKGRCPYCSGKRTLFEESVAYLYDDVDKIFDYQRNNFSLSNVKPTNDRATYWRLECGHTGRSKLKDLVKRVVDKKIDCITCQSISAKKPELLNLFHPVKNGRSASSIHHKSEMNIWWQCKCGFEWKQVLHSKGKSREIICHHCNSLAKKWPELAIQLHPFKNGALTADVIYENYSRKLWWICENKHEQYSTIKQRKSNYLKCCVPIVKLVKEIPNNLLSHTPAFAKQWDYLANYPLTPDRVSCKSMEKRYWICKNGHSFLQTPNSYVNKEKCPMCQTLKVKHPELFKQAIPEKNNHVDLDNLAASSNVKIYWQCPKNNQHIYLTSPVLKIISGINKGCHYCSGMLVTRKESLGGKFPDLLNDWDYAKNTLDPYSISAGTHQKAYWECSKCGYKWLASISNRSNPVRARGCYICNRGLRKNGGGWTAGKFRGFARENISVWRKCSQDELFDVFEDSGILTASTIPRAICEALLDKTINLNDLERYLNWKKSAVDNVCQKYNPRNYGRDSLSKKLRTTIFERDNNTCQNPYCRHRHLPATRHASPTKMTIDHKIPFSHGGTDDEENLHTLCQSCNSRKSTHAWEEFLAIEKENFITN